MQNCLLLIYFFMFACLELSGFYRFIFNINNCWLSSAVVFCFVVWFCLTKQPSQQAHTPAVRTIKTKHSQYFKTNKQISIWDKIIYSNFEFSDILSIFIFGFKTTCPLFCRIVRATKLGGWPFSVQCDMEMKMHFGENTL